MNPLLGRDGYEPVARGMAAALPFIDLFASAHNLESLAALESRGPVAIPDPEGKSRDVFRATYRRIAACVSELSGLMGRKAAA